MHGVSDKSGITGGPNVSVGAAVNIQGVLQAAPSKKNRSDPSAPPAPVLPELHVQSATATSVVGECDAEDNYVLVPVDIAWLD